MSNTKTSEAFFLHGEHTIEPCLDNARNAYFAAADSERSVESRVQSIELLEQQCTAIAKAAARLKASLNA